MHFPLQSGFLPLMPNLATMLIAVLLLQPPSLLAGTIDLPFGLRWGDRPSKILDWAQKEALNASIELPGTDPQLRIVHVSAEDGNLPGHKVRRLTTRYRNGRLFEIVLHYSGEKLAVPVVKGRFLELKRHLARDLGTFETNRIDRTNEKKLRSVSESYHTEPAPGILIIGVYSEVFDDLRKTGEAKFSFIYRNQNLERALSPPLPAPSEE